MTTEKHLSNYKNLQNDHKMVENEHKDTKYIQKYKMIKIDAKGIKMAKMNTE